MRQIGEYEVAGRTYKIGHWPVDKANKMLAFLFSVFGEGLSGAFPKGGMNVLDSDGIAIFGSIINGLFSKISPEEYSSKMREICEGIICDGKAIEYNTHFQGNIFHLHRVAAQVLMHQYKDFLDELPALISLGESAGSSTQDPTM